jgi:serine/threonine-protein kinase
VSTDKVAADQAPIAGVASYFELIRELGHGGMATVYLCRDVRKDELVAVKILRPAYAGALAAERFVREVDFVSKLDHPAIPRIIETGVTGDKPFFVMTYVEGDPLRKVLEKRKQLPVAEAVELCRAILDPLGYAHRHGIVHRDIKPDNIVIGVDRVHILDFGIARAVIDAGGKRLTKTGLTVGTPAYISPEQALGDKDVDQRADIFSLGCVLYEMLAGVQPYSGATPQALIARRFAAPPKPLSEFRSDVPEEVAEATMRALQVAAADRWQSASEFDEALAHAVSLPQDSVPTESPDNDLLAQLKSMFGGQFDVEQEMKGGGMSRLFLATERELNRKVVIKILPPDLTSPMMLARFRRESEVTARLQHPHILPVISAGVRDGLAFYIMPFFRGESLRQMLEREEKLSVRDSVRFLCEITDALSFAHDQGVIHRDIKPENILILGGHAVLADFGIASALSASGDKGERITGTGMSLGTVGYMAPEQALGERTVDGRADVYSLGVVGYEMLSGSPPFTGTTDQAILVGHLTRDPEPLASRRSDSPPGLAAAIHKALQKDPASRFSSAKEFNDAITDNRFTVVDQRSAPQIPAVESKRPQEVQKSLAQRVARHRWKLAIPAVLLGVIALTAYIQSRNATPAKPALDPRKIAVLYFRDLSPGREKTELADAITVDLIQKLSEVNGLDVVSENGAQQIRLANVTADSAAKLLKVGTLVSGTIEPIEGRLRVAVAMLDGSSGEEVQRSTFEYPSADPIAVRKSLVRDVSEFLRQRLGERVQLTELKSATKDARAWELAQHGSRLIGEAQSLSRAGDTAAALASLRTAEASLTSSLQRDSKFIDPVVQLGTAALWRSRISSDAVAMKQWADSGLGFANRALTLDARNAAALELRGTLQYWKWINELTTNPSDAEETLRAAEADLREAVKLAPHRATAWTTLSSLASNKDDPIEAAMAARRAYEEDAYLASASDIIWTLYSTAYDNQQAVAAENWCSEGARRFPSDPQFVRCRLWLLTLPGTKPNIDAAWRLVDELKRVTAEKDWGFYSRESRMLVAAAIARAGLPDSARHVLVKSRGDASVDPTRELLVDEAIVRVIIGDKTDALRILKSYLVAFPEHRRGMAETQSWWWRDIKDDPAFREMVGAEN